ncbi:hypothetical protein ACRW5I_26185, partial [Escherichia coli]
TLKMPAFEWVHVQLHQQKGMISLSPPTICNSAIKTEKCVPIHLSVRTHPPFSAQPSTFHENYSAYPSTFQCVPIHLSF